MTMITKLRELAQRATNWLRSGETAPAAEHTTAVVSDRFDAVTWRETYEEAAALQDLGAELGETHDYAKDLLQDIFLGAYKVSPEVRPADAMLPTRRVNRQVVDTMVNAPEFAELREDTAGDRYAAAMAVLAQAGRLRELLTRTEEAQKAAEQAEQARQEASDAAQAVVEALQAAEQAAGDDGEVDDDAAGAVEAALAAADAAGELADQAGQGMEQALAGAAAGVRAAVRGGLKAASEQAREESALMAAWGVSPGQLQRMSFAERARLAERLRNGRMAAFADLIGRFRQMALSERSHKVEGAPGELIGVTLGSDLARLVPSEVASLADEALRAVFVARFAEGRLFQFETEGEESAGQGAIIACIDCSYSMQSPMRTKSGEPVTGEAWAKACALALLDQAQKAGRDFVGILFSSASQLRVFYFPASQNPDIAEVLEFGELFFGGGTDFETPLAAAGAVLEEEYSGAAKQRGDIVLITDGHCDVSEEWMAAWNEAKQRLGFRVFGIRVGAGAHGRPPAILTALCDDLREVADLADPGSARELFHLI